MRDGQVGNATEFQLDVDATGCINWCCTGRGEDMHLQLESKDFSGGWTYLNWTGNMPCSPADLVRCALTVGRTRLRSGNGQSFWSGAEAQYRTAAVHLFFRNKSGFVSRSPAFNDLEQTEKGGVSFLAGMTLAKRFCEHVLSTGHTVHLTRSKVACAITPPTTKSRPDLLVRMHDGTWFAMEAKGRTYRPGQHLFDQAKAQVSVVTKINGVMPPFGIATCASFDGSEHVLLQAQDPPPGSGDSGRIELSFDPVEALLAYYDPILSMIEPGPSVDVEVVGRTRCLLFAIPGSDVKVGIVEALARILRSRVLSLDAIDELILSQRPSWSPDGRRRSPRTQPEWSPLQSIGPDGIAVVLGTSWESSFAETD